MHLFYADIENKVANLKQNDVHHALKVLRLNIGDFVMVTDGDGKIGKGTIISITKNECIVQLLELNEQQKKGNLHIAIAPTKNNDRFEFFLEKATEIGISSITPILTENSERKKINPERFEKILIAGMKQSQNYYLPRLNNLIAYKDFILKARAPFKFIAHCEDDSKKVLLQYIDKQLETLVLIGPEGDFTHDEIQFAIENGFKPLTLGETRLRTETAAIVATTLYNFTI